MSATDYSKWDHIEVSDDEDDTHPNIDTPSLFRWRHQARVDRMDQAKHEREDLERKHTAHEEQLLDIKRKLKQAEQTAASDQLSKLKIEMGELEKQESEYKKKEEELDKKEKLTPWNVDTLCHDGKSKTIINTYDAKKKPELTDDEKMEKQHNFTKKNEKEIKKFGMYQKYDDSQDYLIENRFLVCEETANFLVLWCIDLEVREKHDLMSHVAHQTMVMQFILELARSLETSPQNCIKPFFSRIKIGEKQYMDAFNEELNSFKDRIQARAEARIEAAMKEVEEDERKKRLGPGGLDPVEVFESLPKSMQACFEEKDIAKLQRIIEDFPKDEAEYHMKRCVESGLWVPDGGKKAEGGGEGEEDSDEEYEEATEEVEAVKK